MRLEPRLLALFFFLLLVPAAGYYIVSSKVLEAKNAVLSGAVCYTGNSTIVFNVSFTVDNPSLLPYRVKAALLDVELRGLNTSLEDIQVLKDVAGGRSSTRIHMVVRLGYNGSCGVLGYKWITGNMTLRVSLEPSFPPVGLFSKKVSIYIPVKIYARVAGG